ncbi:MAG: hypothetical protein KGN01_07620 [Patescibacteria group bacterium]|nr:hypothetical protein [Patescibacteria group bacterium]
MTITYYDAAASIEDVAYGFLERPQEPFELSNRDYIDGFTKRYKVTVMIEEFPTVEYKGD